MQLPSGMHRVENPGPIHHYFFNGIPVGDYVVAAFLDENNNAYPDPGERRGGYGPFWSGPGMDPVHFDLYRGNEGPYRHTDWKHYDGGSFYDVALREIAEREREFDRNRDSLERGFHDFVNKYDNNPIRRDEARNSFEEYLEEVESEFDSNVDRFRRELDHFEATTGRNNSRYSDWNGHI